MRIDSVKTSLVKHPAIIAKLEGINVNFGATKCDNCPVGYLCYYDINVGTTKCESCPTGSKCPYIDFPPVLCQKREKAFAAF